MKKENKPITTESIQADIESGSGPSQIESHRLDGIFPQIIQSLPEIDFHKALNLGPTEKVRNPQAAVVVVEQIRQTARSLNFDICIQNGALFSFNSKCWDRLSPDEVKHFLFEAAMQVGMPSLEAKPYRFRDELYKQLLADVILPAPKRDRHISLINCGNGTLEIGSDGHVNLRDFAASDFLTYVLPFDYQPDARCDMFQAFLDRVIPETQAQYALAELVGSIFTDLNLEKIGMLYGDGANGKSVFAKVIMAMIGRENVTCHTLASLSDHTGYYRADINNRLLNYSTESGIGMDPHFIKQLASREPIEARMIYGKPFNMINYAHIIVNSNVLPTDVEATHAFLRRFMVVPFNVEIPIEEQDIHLAEKIIATELPGVLNWVLAGLLRLVSQNGFTRSDLIEAANREFEELADSFATFMKDAQIEPGSTCSIPFTELYEKYKQFAHDQGLRAISKINFSKKLRKRHFEISRTHAGTVIYCSKK